MMRRVTFFVPSIDLSFPTTFSNLPQRRHKILKAMRIMVSGVADDETRFDRCGAFLSAWRKHKNAPMVAATLQPMPVKAVAAWRIFGGGSGETFLDEKSEMSAWRRVGIIDMYFLTVASVSSKQKTQPFDHHLLLYVVVVFSWLSKVSEPDYEPTHFGIHHMDIADGRS
jgi:hypothetical protein